MRRWTLVIAAVGLLVGALDAAQADQHGGGGWHGGGGGWHRGGGGGWHGGGGGWHGGYWHGGYGGSIYLGFWPFWVPFSYPWSPYYYAPPATVGASPPAITYIQRPPAITYIQRPEGSLEKITLAADAYFDFDRATLKPAGRAKLDKLVEKIGRYEHVEAIHITAYTDRLGSEPYNLNLSDRRAYAVMNYLVNHGISAGKIDARGMGEANPVVGCEGVRPRAALIECLAPNRRAEIDIVGAPPT
jgi:outer membrane protein OmpA-like peptidoglycan-associated protein